MYSIHKLNYSHQIAGLMNNNCSFFFHITGSSFMRIDGRRRNATQRSRQSFCQDYRANPSPRLSCIATLPHAASEQSQFNRKVDLLCNMKTRGHKSLKAQSSIRWNTRSTHELHTCTESMWKKLHTHQGSGSEFYGAQSFLICEWLTDTPDLHWDKSSSEL